MGAEVAQEQFPSTGSQVQREHRGTVGSRGGNLREEGIDLLVASGDHLPYRLKQTLTGQIRLLDGANQLKTRSLPVLTRLERRVDLLIDERNRDAHADRYRSASQCQQRQIPPCG